MFTFNLLNLPKYFTRCTTIPLKSKLPPSCLTSLETRLEKQNKSQLKRDRSCFLLLHWKYQYFAFKDLLYNVHIVLISAVDMIFILIRDACVPCVYYKMFFVSATRELLVAS